MKRLDCEILEICELKDIEKDVEESEDIISRVLDVKKKTTKVMSEAACPQSVQEVNTSQSTSAEINQAE